MNRTIKFRVWDGKTLHYIDKSYNYFLTFNSLDNWILWYKYGDGKEEKITDAAQKESAIQQFTELHDKNGKEIYEGDIVKFTDDNKESWNEEIKFELLAWNYFLCNVCGNIESTEVVGNIYENPELLEK